MSITKDYLKSLGIEGMTDEIIKEIVANHGKVISQLETKNSDYEKNYILKSEYDGRAEEVKKLSGELKTANNKVSELEKNDFKGLSEKYNILVGEHSKLETTYKDKLNSTILDGLIREKLAKHNYSSPYAQKGVYDEVKLKVKLTGDENDGYMIDGYDDAIKSIQESMPSAFIAESSNNAINRGDSGGRHTNSDTKTFTMEQIKQMSQQEVNNNWGAIQKSLAENK